MNFFKKDQTIRINRKRLVTVQYDQRSRAKELGAKWDNVVKSWWVPEIEYKDFIERFYGKTHKMQAKNTLIDMLNSCIEYKY